MTLRHPRSVAEARLLVTRLADDLLGSLYRDSAVPQNFPPDEFDCSTFTHYLWASVGLDLDRAVLTTDEWPPHMPTPWRKYPGYTQTQRRALTAAGARIDASAIKPGDVAYYSTPDRRQHHVVLYVGNGEVIHAAGRAYGVIRSPFVRPGETGHGGKQFTDAFSPALLLGRLANLPAVVAQPKPPRPKPPAPRLPACSLSRVQRASRIDPPAPQGHTSAKSDVLLVERALHQRGLLRAAFVDGSFGTRTVDAYAAWQRRLGYTGRDADGIPGGSSLRKLGQVSGLFRVVP